MILGYASIRIRCFLNKLYVYKSRILSVGENFTIDYKYLLKIPRGASDFLLDIYKKSTQLKKLFHTNYRVVLDAKDVTAD